MALAAAWLSSAAQVAFPEDSAPPVAGNTAQVKAIVRRLQRHYRATDSFDAKFSETVTSAGGARREREGTIAYRKPGRLRWDFGPPQLETIVSDGNTLYVYEPDLNQVVETPLERAFRTSAPAALLLGMGDVERDFTAAPASAPPKDKLLHLSLTARGDGTLIALGLDPKTYDVVALTLTDQLGNVTGLHFSDIRTNQPVDDSRFSFKVPEGTDVVTAPNPR